MATLHLIWKINKQAGWNFFLKEIIWHACLLNRGEYSSRTTLHVGINYGFNLKRNLLEGGSQKNETEVGDNRKWNAVSVIEVAFSQVSRFVDKRLLRTQKRGIHIRFCFFGSAGTFAFRGAKNSFIREKFSYSKAAIRWALPPSYFGSFSLPDTSYL